MREILFKAKRVDNGEWVEGNYGCVSNLPHRNLYYIEEYKGSKWEINPLTVCQYTGLTDKNGKKIFEGDEINDGDWSKGYVSWDEKDCSFGYYDEVEIDHYIITSNLELTGKNIHDGNN